MNRLDAVGHILHLNGLARSFTNESSCSGRLVAEDTINLLTKQTEYLEEEIKELTSSYGIIAEDLGMKNVLNLIEQVAETDATVLINGETGTGKELVARAIHQLSDRNNKPLIRINCGAIPSNLIESELFGHEKGAFTGATATRKGRFLLADKGTIFLDEIGELPLDLQSLRFVAKAQLPSQLKEKSSPRQSRQPKRDCGEPTKRTLPAPEGSSL